jgi:aspartyl-tRNA(Asn)/glutamyl-tRNA(Gln) amidotransferase subunit A
MEYASLDAIRADLASEKITVSALTDFYLTRIGEQADLNAFNEVFTESAREQALAVDRRLASGNAGKLAGLVIGIKDNICIKGKKVTASSRILENFESQFSATVVERLLAEDAVIIGRLNCDEFAMGSSNENSAYGAVLNPLDKSRVPGGSSGGSAAAVAAGLCHAALGSDTGGSIRQPAAFCGNVGIKPTYGRVSRWGLLAYASSFDQIGPITNCAADAAEILSAIGGFDENDATSSSNTNTQFSNKLPEGKKLRVAYLADLLENPSITESVRKAYADIIAQLQNQGHETVAESFNYFDFLVPAYYVLTTAEASSNLSRYDGIRYGRRSPNTVDLETAYKKSRSEGFGKEVKNRIMLGTFVLSAGFYDAYYGKAQKVRRVVTDAMHKLLENNDVLLIPTTPDVAFKFGENSGDPIQMYLQDIFTVQANITGHPAISFPYGKDGQQLPIGMQAIGRYFDESTLFQVADLLEKN